VTPPEDLMREHGVLDRVLLNYDAAVLRQAIGAPMSGARRSVK
jgi:hypothetical protein